MSELKPCPCCEHEANIIIHKGIGKTRYYVNCPRCGIHTNEKFSEAEVCEIWNNRPELSASDRQAKDDYNAAIATAPASELADTIAAAVKEAGELLGAPAALLRDPCTWREDDEGTWFTDCDNAWAFVDAGPEENNMAFCPFCGGPLVTMRYQCDEEDEDG